MDKLKVAMIGVGHSHADEVMWELRQQKDVFDVIGYYDDNKELMDKKIELEQYTDLKQLEAQKLKENEYGLQGLIIEADMPNLLRMSEEYIGLKLPMHIDKPITQDYERFVNLMDTAKACQIPIQMGYMYRYNEAVQKCLSMLQGQEYPLGTLYETDAVMNTELNFDQRKSLANYKGGVMYVYGCHVIDLIIKFNGVPKNIYSFINQTGFDGIKSDDCAMVVFEYENGTSFARTTAAEANGYVRRQLVLCGSKGTAVLEPMEMPDKNKHILSGSKLKYALRNGADAYKDKSTEIQLKKDKRRYQDMLVDFAKMIRGENDLIFPCDYEYEKTVEKVLLQACGINI